MVSMEKLAAAMPAINGDRASADPRTMREPMFQLKASPAAISERPVWRNPCERQSLISSRMMTQNSNAPALWPTVLIRIGSRQLSWLGMFGAVLSQYCNRQPVNPDANH